MGGVVRSRLEQGWAEGFDLLRRVPDVLLWKSLSYIDSLSEIHRGEFFDMCEQLSQQTFTGERGSGELQQTLAQRQLHQVQAARTWSAYSDRFLRQFDLEGLREMRIDEARIPRILASDPPVIAKAGAIRKVLHKRLKEQFEAKVTNIGGGVWTCVGKASDSEFALRLDYGGMGQGFYYGVTFGSASATALGSMFQSPYALPGRAIDFPMADELVELADVFCEGILDLERYFSNGG